MTNYVGKNARLYVASGVDGGSNPIDWAALEAATPGAIAGSADWERICKISVDKTRGTETSDASDDCNPDATLITKKVKEISCEVFVKKDASENIAAVEGEGIDRIREAYEAEALISVLSLDAAREDTGAAGDWMLANVTQFDESQPLTDTTQYSFTFVPSGSVVIQNSGYIKTDVGN